MNQAVLNIVGCALDGLHDHVSVWGEEKKIKPEDGFFLKNVVLPEKPLGKLLTGKEARDCSRVATGLHWPPEAKIEEGAFLRRIPVSYLWRLLVEANDKTCRWTSGPGTSFPIAKILGEHIINHLSGIDKEQDITITIPNELDEFGQEELLNVFRGKGYQEIKLLWRPVAAALTWLEHVQSQFSGSFKSEDFIIIVHLGPDGFEFVPFRLRERQKNGTTYMIPLRERPTVITSYTGLEWAYNLLQSFLETKETNEIGAFWQAFSNFPEIWQTLGQERGHPEKLPRPWCFQKGWKLWNPAEKQFSDRMWTLKYRDCESFNALTDKSCQKKVKKLSEIHWIKLLQDHVIEAGKVYNGKLRGLILSGALASQDPMPWLEEILPKLKERGLKGAPAKQPQLDGIWIPGLQQNIVAEGAAIYGKRLREGVPTYLDTLPQLSLLAQKKNKREWRPLTDSEEIEGGKPFERLIEQEFSLPRGKKTLTMYLNKDQEEYRKLEVDFPYAPDKSIPLNMHVSMSPASGLAQVTFESTDPNFNYGREIFLDYSKMEDTDDPILEFEKNGTASFPPTKKGHLTERNDSKILGTRFEKIYYQFLQTNVDDPNYKKNLEKLINTIKKLVSNNPVRRIVDKNGMSNTPEGQNILDKISKKMGQDLENLQKIDPQKRFEVAQQEGIFSLDDTNKVRRQIKSIFIIAEDSSWLFKNIPHQITDFLKNELLKGKEERIDKMIRAAGRTFTTEDGIKILYQAIVKRIEGRSKKNNPFPIYEAKAISQILEWREQGTLALSEKDSKIFVERALENMKIRADKNDFKDIFFSNVKLFLYLLRYRKIAPDFLNPNAPENSEVFEKVFNYLKAAENYFDKNRQNEKKNTAFQLQEGIEKYKDSQGTAGIVELFDEFIEEDQ